MIPTMIVFGLLAGRWWRTALVAGAVIWPLLLWQAGIYAQVTGSGVHGGGGVLGLTLGAAALGATNTAIGVAVHQGVLALVRRVLRRGTLSAHA